MEVLERASEVREGCCGLVQGQPMSYNFACAGMIVASPPLIYRPRHRAPLCQVTLKTRCANARTCASRSPHQLPFSCYSSRWRALQASSFFQVCLDAPWREARSKGTLHRLAPLLYISLLISPFRDALSVCVLCLIPSLSLTVSSPSPPSAFQE